MGRATAHLFADEGAKVAVTDLDQEKVDMVVDEIRGVGGSGQISEPARDCRSVGVAVCQSVGWSVGRSA